jgi:hypothetical protein
MPINLLFLFVPRFSGPFQQLDCKISEETKHGDPDQAKEEPEDDEYLEPIPSNGVRPFERDEDHLEA